MQPILRASHDHTHAKTSWPTLRYKQLNAQPHTDTHHPTHARTRTRTHTRTHTHTHTHTHAHTHTHTHTPYPANGTNVGGRADAFCPARLTTATLALGAHLLGLPLGESKAQAQGTSHKARSVTTTARMRACMQQGSRIKDQGPHSSGTRPLQACAPSGTAPLELSCSC